MALFDFLKTKEFKKEIETLTEENTKIKENLSEIKKLTEKTEVMTIIELQEEINSNNEILSTLHEDVKAKKDEVNSLDNVIKELKSQVTMHEDEIFFESYALYKPRYAFANSSSYKEKLTEVRDKQKLLIKNKTAVNFNPNWTIDGNKAKGKKFTNDNIKMILRAFNNECEAAINKVKAKNFDSIQKRISKSFEQINKLNITNSCSLTVEFYDLKISELHLAYEYERKKEEEKEELREQRQKEREEKALQKEIQSKTKVIDKEINHLQNMITELEAKLASSAESQNEDLENQIQELKENMNSFEEEKEELDYRLVHSSAGYVYIISNIGSFGEDVYKIGVTRRLEPLDRINELSSASVPFKFDVHALIFSYEAYDLENKLHELFSDKRINMVNSRKEFFKLDMEDIKTELAKYGDLTIDFNEVPDAEEYRETISIANTKEKVSV